MDAAIMDGRDRNAGAVAGLTTVKNPITAARAVMENSPHVFMTGAGAEVFAKEQELELVSPDYFYTDFRFQQLEKIRETEKNTTGPQLTFRAGASGSLFQGSKIWNSRRSST